MGTSISPLFKRRSGAHCGLLTGLSLYIFLCILGPFIACPQRVVSWRQRVSPDGFLRGPRRASSFEAFTARLVRVGERRKPDLACRARLPDLVGLPSFAYVHALPV